MNKSMMLTQILKVLETVKNLIRGVELFEVKTDGYGKNKFGVEDTVIFIDIDSKISSIEARMSVNYTADNNEIDFAAQQSVNNNNKKKI